MSNIQQQIDSANRLEEIYHAYWAGAIVDESATLEEVMKCLDCFVRGSAN